MKAHFSTPEIQAEKGERTKKEAKMIGWFVRNKSKIEYVVISSETTQNIITTRREDNIELFS